MSEQQKTAAPTAHDPGGNSYAGADNPALEVVIDEGLKPATVADLLKNAPVVIEVGPFTPVGAAAFQRDVAAAARSEQPIVPIVIDSYGGDVYALLRMLDTMQNATARTGVKFATIGVAKAMSCGAFLLGFGAPGMRYAAEGTTIMVHDISSIVWGKLPELVSDVKYTERISDKLFLRLDQSCNQKPGYWKGQIKENSGADIFLDAQDALRQGLVDWIGIPRLRASVTIGYEWLQPTEAK